MTVDGVESGSWPIQYVTSIYWAITTMITVGYGDIVPITKTERIFAMFIMILACGVFAYTVTRPALAQWEE